MVFCIILFTVFFILNSSTSISAQVKIIERISSDNNVNKGLYLESPHRQKINLNGIWQVSFGDNENFINLNVPLCYVFDDDVRFKKDFNVHDSLIRSSSFILVAEGINDDSQIKINGSFVARNYGGYQTIITSLDENIIKHSNTIEINISYIKDFRSSIPFKKQFQYARNYSGIDKDIYLIAVPKIYAFENNISYNYESNSTIRIINTIDLISGNLDSLRNISTDFSVRTRIISKISGEEITLSSPAKFNIDNFQTIQAKNEILSSRINNWSPANPELYFVITEIYIDDNVIDSKTIETGFVKTEISYDRIIINNTPFFINGINYFEFSPKYGSALEYSEIESDVKTIKEYGFNCIKVPGRIPHPYLVNICQRVGMFLFSEIPVCNVPSNIINDERYRKEALSILEKNLKRDRYSPCILMWGIGNDFDVTVDQSALYVKSALEVATSLDWRRIYYTTRNIDNDRCVTDNVYKGINIYSSDTSYANFVLMNKTGNNSFISNIGVRIDNNNRNGSLDIFSQEYQALFIINAYKNLNKSHSGIFLSAYSDYYSDSPQLYPISDDYYLISSGIFDINRNAKFSAGIIKRYLNNQIHQKINEGLNQYNSDNKAFVIIISGITVLLLIAAGLSRIRFFKDNVIKSLIGFRNFNMIIREQNPIPFFHNLFAQFLTALGISVYVVSLLYYLRKSQDFNMLSSVVLPNDNFMIYFSRIINDPLIGILAFPVLILIIMFTVLVIINNFMIFSKRITNFKSTLSAVTWSFFPLIIFTLVGTVFLKYSEFNSEFFNYTIWFFILLYIICILRLLMSVRIIYDLSFSRTYIAGFVLVIIIHGLLYSYLVYFKSFMYFLELIKSYS